MANNYYKKFTFETSLLKQTIVFVLFIIFILMFINSKIDKLITKKNIIINSYLHILVVL